MRQIAIATVLTITLTVSSLSAEPVSRGVPTPEQRAWHAMELQMFLCLDPCTWQGREYDNHSTPLSKINPTRLDTDQWCRVAKSFGARQILFVAKHTGGFCWWQTETSNYSIKDTSFKNGKGDVLAELSTESAVTSRSTPDMSGANRPPTMVAISVDVSTRS